MYVDPDGRKSKKQTVDINTGIVAVMSTMSDHILTVLFNIILVSWVVRLQAIS